MVSVARTIRCRPRANQLDEWSPARTAALNCLGDRHQDRLPARLGMFSAELDAPTEAQTAYSFTLAVAFC